MFNNGGNLSRWNSAELGCYKTLSEDKFLGPELRQQGNQDQFDFMKDELEGRRLFCKRPFTRYFSVRSKEDGQKGWKYSVDDRAFKRLFYSMTVFESFNRHEPSTLTHRCPLKTGLVQFFSKWTRSIFAEVDGSCGFVFTVDG